MTLHDDGFPDFVWAVGEEGSDPIVLVDGQPLRHDQYEQSGHYGHLHHDLGDIAALGVSVVRYGMPWRRTEPEPGIYDWSLWDEALQSCRDAGLEPIVDLLHFGLPDHYQRFSDTGWIAGFCRYVDAFLARYDEPRWFTPINEPGITALLSARFGLWNDRLSSPAAHARALANVVLANLEALERIHADRNAMWIGAEGFDAPVAVISGFDDEVARRRALAWLVWDLHLGIDPLPPAAAYLDPVDDSIRSRIAALARQDRLIAGHDLYPTSIQAIGGVKPDWSIAELIDLGITELLRWHDRYQMPFWIGETSNLTLPVDQQVSWLEQLAVALAGLRSDGHPVRGMCWYSRGDQYDWQTALAKPTGAVTEVGLFDTSRRARPVAGAFAALAKAAS